jgi:hypothetical protein
MATYLVIHSPKESAKAEEAEARPPTRLVDLARDHGGDGAQPQWIKTWSPDLHDDRLFSLWDSTDAESILKTIEAFGFLDDMTAHPVRVQEWGPATVLESEAE